MGFLNRVISRRALPWAIAALLAIAVIVALGSAGGSRVTRPRLERSLNQAFANLYVQQAEILGRRGVSVDSLHVRSQCAKGGPPGSKIDRDVPDQGPGADWICWVAWDDPHVPLPDGFGKFDLNVHSNDCYTAGGPTKLVGFMTITDKKGNDVPNPVFEFDACFDPHSSNAPTGVVIPPPPAR